MINSASRYEPKTIREALPENKHLNKYLFIHLVELDLPLWLTSRGMSQGEFKGVEVNISEDLFFFLVHWQ